MRICGYINPLDSCTWPVLIPKVVLNGFPRRSNPLSRHVAADSSRVGFLNATGRGLTDRIAVLDTRGPGRLASRIKWLSVDNFSGIKGDGTMNLHGFDIRQDENTDALHILLINHRPPIDPDTGEPLDATHVGANSTIEHFRTDVGSDSMRLVKTYVDPLIQTPNRVAWVTDTSFVFTNDHSAKVGYVSSLFQCPES